MEGTSMKFRIQRFQNPPLMKWVTLVFIGGVTFMIFELSNSPDAYWSNPDSIYSTGPSYSPMSLWLFQNLLTIGKKLNPLHPHAVYQLIIAIWATLTGLIVFQWSWSLYENVSPVKKCTLSLLVSLSFSLNPLIWQSVAQGEILLVQTGFIALVLYLWNVPDLKSKKRFWIGMFIFSLVLPMSPYSVPLVIIAMLQITSFMLRQKQKYRLTALLSVLLITAGLLPLFCFALFKPDFLSLQWLRLNAIRDPCSISPVTIRAGFSDIFELLKKSIGLFGWLIFLIFPIIRFRFQKGRGILPYWLTFLFAAVSLGVLLQTLNQSVGPDAVSPFLIPLHLLLVPIYTSFLGSVARAVRPGILIAGTLIITAVLLSKWPAINLAHDHSYRDLIRIVETYQSRSDRELRFLNHCFLNSEKTEFSYQVQAFEFGLLKKSISDRSPQALGCAMDWTRSIHSHFKPSPSNRSGFHRISSDYLSLLWGDIGTFWLDRYLISENDTVRKEAMSLAYQAYTYALNMPPRSLPSAACYSEAIALFLFENKNFNHFLAYTIQSAQLSPAQLESRMRLYKIAKHSNNQREMLRLLNQIIAIQPENLFMKTELARLFAVLGYNQRGRIIYEHAVKDGAERQASFESQLPPLTEPAWPARNIMVIQPP
jgi:hypothetical protein